MGLVESSNLNPQMQSHRLSSQQLIRLAEQFKAMSANFAFSKQTLKRLYNAKIPDLDFLFQLFDPKQKGNIDGYEFMAGMILLADASLDLRAEILYELFDFDGSLTITFEELVIILKCAMQALGYITNSTLLTMRELIERTKVLFDKIDINGDGSLSVFEFISFMTKDTQLVQFLSNLGLATYEDIRPNWGTDQDPEVDSDLENEVSVFNQPSMREKKQQMTAEIPQIKQKSDGNFASGRPWQAAVAVSCPSDYVPVKGEDDPPDANLQLEYVYGYRCHDSRNNVKFNQNRQLVYHTAAVGISLNIMSNEQSHYINHQDDIISFDMNNLGTLAVSGEIGKKPLLCVWNTLTMQTVSVFEGLLTKGIQAVAISSDESCVAGLGADDTHTLVVYDLKSNQGRGIMKSVVALGNLGRDTYLDIQFRPNDNTTLIACGVKVFSLVKVESQVLSVKKGIGWGKSPDTQHQALTSIGFINDKTYTGGYNGCLFEWADRNLVKATKIHEDAIIAISETINSPGLITGGNDGFINILDSNLQKLRSFDLKLIGSSMPKVRGLAQNADESIVCGTRGGELIQFNRTDHTFLLKGHYNRELWGLCVDQSNSFALTAGQDQLLTKLDLLQRQCISHLSLEAPAQSIALSPDDQHISVGYENGKIQILDFATFEVLFNMHDRNKGVTQVKYSPNGAFLAASGHDQEVIIYLAQESYSLHKRLRGHTSTVTHLDFSVGSDILQSCSSSYEVLYHDLLTGNLNSSGSTEYKDEHWQTWSLVIGWPVLGIFPAYSDGTDVNSAQRSPSGRVICTTDDFGLVKLFRYPCVRKNPGFNEFKGHSSHVTNCKFAGQYLLTSGGNDKAIFQWRYIEEEPQEVQVNQNQAAQLTEDFDLQRQKTITYSRRTSFSSTGNTASRTSQVNKLKKATNSPSKIDYGPMTFQPPPNHASPPDIDLQLTQVFGYRTFDTKNNLKFAVNNNIIYHTAALGITMDLQTQQQSFFKMHSDDIVSMAIHPNRQLVATGQMAHAGASKQIELFIWDANTLQSIQCLKGHHEKAIRHLSFSTCGKYLASIGEDSNHTLAVFDWELGRNICTVKIDKDAVFGLNYFSTDDLAIYGLKFIKFVKVNGQNSIARRGIFGGKSEVEGQLCGTYFNDKFLTGTYSGKIFAWENRALINAIKAHEAHLYSMCTSGNLLITGGGEGTIITWDASFNQIQTVSIVESCIAPGVRSLDVNADGTILAGTRGSDIILIEQQNVKVLATGHHHGEAWGLAMHSSQLIFATCGGDKVIRVWDILEAKQIKVSQVFKQDLRAIDWLNTGEIIAVGFVDAAIALIDADSLQGISKLQSSFEPPNNWIEDIKFSPDGTKLAFGSHGGASELEIMLVNNRELSKGFTINVGISSALLHVDWSIDSQIVMINSQAYEQKFYDITNKQALYQPQVSDVQWASWTCKLGWQVQYIWPKFSDGSDINSVDRSKNQKLLATADDFGQINLFKFPVVIQKQGSKSYTGHSSHVTRVRFSYDDQYVVSVGGNDKSVFIWKTNLDQQQVEEAEEIDDSQVIITDTVVEKPKTVKEKNRARVRNSLTVESTGRQSLNARQSITSNKVLAGKTQGRVSMNDAFTRYNPYPQERQSTMEAIAEDSPFSIASSSQSKSGAIKPPTNFIKPPRNYKLPPAVDLQLEWVHGYRAKDCRDNIKYLADDRIIYHAAGLGIISDRSSQTFFNKHVDDITAFALSHDTQLAATGEIGRYPSIYVWYTSTLTELAQFKSPLQKGIAALDFSPSSDILIAVGMDNNHSIALYNIPTKSLILSQNGDLSQIVDVTFVSETEFITVGIKHYKFWTVEEQTTSARKGIFEGRSNVILSIAIFNSKPITGAADGNIYQWNRNNIEAEYQIHERAVDTLWTNQSVIVSGSKDGKVCILNPDFTIIQQFDINEEKYGCISSLIRSAAMNSQQTKLIIGTYGSEIIEINLSDQSAATLVRGHFSPNRGTTVTDEVWGLTMLQDNIHYATCSDDATLRIWNIQTKSQTHIINFAQNTSITEAHKARSLAQKPDGTHLAVGFKDGSFKILQSSDWSLLISKQDREEEVSDMKYSPDSSKLAIGTHENFIDIYNADSYELLSTCEGHSSYITHIDWSLDSYCLHSTCGAYELLFWEAESGRQIPHGASEMRDEEWHTWTTTIGWPVQGIFPPYTDGTDINAVSRSQKLFGNNEYRILATGDDYSCVKVFRYPCLQNDQESIIGVGHSSHVTNVRFSNDDEYLISTGGDDQCVMQWKLIS